MLLWNASSGRFLEIVMPPAWLGLEFLDCVVRQDPRHSLGLYVDISATPKGLCIHCTHYRVHLPEEVRKSRLHNDSFKGRRGGRMVHANTDFDWGIVFVYGWSAYFPVESVSTAWWTQQIRHHAKQNWCHSARDSFCWKRPWDVLISSDRHSLFNPLLFLN